MSGRGVADQARSWFWKVRSFPCPERGGFFSARDALGRLEYGKSGKRHVNQRVSLGFLLLLLRRREVPGHT